MQQSRPRPGFANYRPVQAVTARSRHIPLNKWVEGEAENLKTE